MTQHTPTIDGRDAHGGREPAGRHRRHFDELTRRSGPSPSTTLILAALGAFAAMIGALYITGVLATPTLAEDEAVEWQPHFELPATAYWPRADFGRMTVEPT